MACGGPSNACEEAVFGEDGDCVDDEDDHWFEVSVVRRRGRGGELFIRGMRPNNMMAVVGRRKRRRG